MLDGRRHGRFQGGVLTAPTNSYWTMKLPRVCFEKYEPCQEKGGDKMISAKVNVCC